MDLNERIDAWKTDFKGFVETLNLCKDDYEGIMEYIDEVPYPERKKGYWYDCWCSECGWSFEVEPGFVGSPKRFRFCPNCGADMRDNKKEDGE